MTGVIQLPMRLDWSERTEFHLDDPAERNVMYERVIREATRVDDLRNASFARLNVRSDAENAKVELSLDWRKNDPVRLAVGPVLHADDAVANKVCALFGWGAVS